MSEITSGQVKHDCETCECVVCDFKRSIDQALARNKDRMTKEAAIQLCRFYLSMSLITVGCEMMGVNEWTREAAARLALTRIKYGLMEDIPDRHPLANVEPMGNA